MDFCSVRVLTELLGRELVQVPDELRSTMTADPTDIPIARQISMHAVTRALLASGPTSRAELAKRTGLSKQTISAVVRELEGAGWLAPLGRTAGRPGRSAVTYAINGRAALAGAIDLGGSKLHVAIVDLLGEVVGETIEPTDPRGGAHVLAQIGRLLDQLTAGLAPALRRLRLVVLGVPGILHPETGHITVAPNIQGLSELDVRRALTERTGAPVVMENDVNLAARGEQWRGHGVGVANFVLIGLGTGIGMGIIADGHLLRGGRGGAGEVAYLPIGGDPFDARGFRLGTLENAVGSVAIAERYAGLVGSEGITVRDIFTRLAAGDGAAAATLEETARLAAAAIAAVVAVLDPELVVLGGGIGARIELIDRIRRLLPRCTPFPPRLELSALGNRATLTGAIGVAVGRMHDDFFGIGVPTSGSAPPLVAEPAKALS
jgi:predicted NBD/HSP70 family sugar kinase